MQQIDKIRCLFYKSFKFCSEPCLIKNKTQEDFKIKKWNSNTEDKVFPDKSVTDDYYYDPMQDF